ncbi:MAG: hypothetical protein C5S43_00805 [Candidatus Methanocomedens sp.]|nr:MAG: hypothetical protein C5S43_00805 [ANME-2 cluster archaeon]
MKVIKNIDETLFIEFDDENANTTISGVPVMFISKKTMGSLIKGMIDTLGEGVRPLFIHLRLQCRSQIRTSGNQALGL